MCICFVTVILSGGLSLQLRYRAATQQDLPDGAPVEGPQHQLMLEWNLQKIALSHYAGRPENKTGKLVGQDTQPDSCLDRTLTIIRTE